MRKAVKRNIYFLTRRYAEPDERAASVRRKKMLDVRRVKLQNRMHQGCVKAVPDGIAGNPLGM